jgi:hypothetical protein
MINHFCDVKTSFNLLEQLKTWEMVDAPGHQLSLKVSRRIYGNSFLMLDWLSVDQLAKNVFHF